MGQAVLDGLPGVIKVTRGWHNRREINTVTYDPTKISIYEMIEKLNLVDTFVDLVE